MGTELRHLLAAAVEAARLHAGVSGLWLAEQAHIAPQQWDDLVHEREDFTIVDLAGIAAALRIPVTSLLPCSVSGDC